MLLNNCIKLELFLRTTFISLYDCGIIQQVYTANQHNIVSFTRFSQLLCKVHSSLKITARLKYNVWIIIIHCLLI